ncbi:UNVERIFIED_CONTAM: hypothetical protein Sangu_2237900 [Sesamum angustifolium]|uniref:Uncharacterized protein n=1 Tax=Sesamum angustifolium TaxID=2727405 RepID=A0AAW2L3P7_9LAMI
MTGIEKCSSSKIRNNGGKEEIASCWGRFMMLMLLCRRSKKAHRKLENSKNDTSKSKRRAQPSASFRYSPQSYSQNFDEGPREWEDDGQDSLLRGFQSRYAAPYSSHESN